MGDPTRFLGSYWLAVPIFYLPMCLLLPFFVQKSSRVFVLQCCLPDSPELKEAAEVSWGLFIPPATAAPAPMAPREFIVLAQQPSKNSAGIVWREMKGSAWDLRKFMKEEEAIRKRKIERFPFLPLLQLSSYPCSVVKCYLNQKKFVQKRVNFMPPGTILIAALKFLTIFLS